MKEYETVFVLHPSLDEQQVDAQIESVQEMIKAGSGDVIGVERWGRRKFAYEVKKVHEGIYTLVRFRSGVQVLHDLERRYRLREDVLRYLTVIAQGPPPEPPAPAAVAPAERSETAGDTPSAEAAAATPTTEEPKTGETPVASDVTSSEETSESSSATTEEPPKEDVPDEAKSQES